MESNSKISISKVPISKVLISESDFIIKTATSMKWRSYLSSGEKHLKT